MLRSVTIKTVLGMLLFFSIAQAQTGALNGRVLDAEDQLPLAGANVSIPTLTIGATTGGNGEFQILNIPEGTYDVVVDYLGYQTSSRPLEISADLTTNARFELSSGIVDGEEVVVLGERLKGQAKALNVQRSNTNISNIVSSDQVGKFADSNIGDALKRVPAITVNYDQGEARFANIRGTEPRLNSIMINGERLPSAEGEIRAVQLDLIPAEVIQSIEVFKAVTPDMEADAIGGAVNLITRQAPIQRRISGTLGSGYNVLREEPLASAAGILANRYGDRNQFGVVLSGSYNDNRFGSDNTEGEWDEDDGEIFVDEWDVRRYDLRRLRRSASLSMDYQLNPRNTFYAKGIFNIRKDWENRFRYRVGLDSIRPDGAYIMEIRRQTKGGIDTDEIDNKRLEDQRTYNMSFSGDHIIGKDIKLNWLGAYSKASEERPNERYISWRNRDVPFIWDFSDLEAPLFSAANASDVEPGEFSLREITEENQYTDEQDFTVRMDVEVPGISTGANKNSMKFGLRHKSKDKRRENNFFEFEPVGDRFDDFSQVVFSDQTDEGFEPGAYEIGDFTTPELLGSLDLDDPNQFEKTDLPEEYAAANYSAEEDITAAYAMINQNIGSKLLLIGGVRVEATDIKYRGFEYDENTEAVTATDGNDQYINVLPGFHARYELTDRTILRGAWTNTLARPNYYQLVPYRAVAEDFEELEAGNPELDPTTSMNFDFMAEHYFASVGLISAGVFYKDIDDFIFTNVTEDYVDPVTGNTFDEFFQPLNGASASLLGFEFAFQRQLGFLPGILGNLGLYSNYTYTTSEADNPEFRAEADSDEKIDLPGTAPHTLNLALNYNGKRLLLGASFNYTSDYLDPDALDLTPGLERFYDEVTYLDVNGSFKFSEQLRLFVEANNLLNQPLRYYAGDPSRTYQAEYYQTKFNVGLKFDM
ncbi:MAG: TonB-dependent receptor [Calditrichia bacterium]